MYILSFYPKGQLNMTEFNTGGKEGSKFEPVFWNLKIFRTDPDSRVPNPAIWKTGSGRPINYKSAKNRR
jgi:hypothetical protein